MFAVDKISVSALKWVFSIMCYTGGAVEHHGAEEYTS